jgi:putative zinc finger/helix-turn-helix YgiT family protein
MKCKECGAELKSAVTTHRYAESGLPNVILHGVEVRTCAACGEEEVAIPNIAGLHRCIAHQIAIRPSALTPAELRFLRQCLGHSSQDFARMIGRTPETYSRWETGASRISPLADRLVRMLVMRSEPRTDYTDEMLAAIDPKPPKTPRLELRRQGNAWQANRAA